MSEQGGGQMPISVRFYAQNRETGRRCCRTYTDDPRNSASLLETLQQKAMEQKTESKNKNRERSSESVRQHFVLSTRDPFFFVVLFLL